VKNIIQINNLHYRPVAYPTDKPDILNGVDLNITEGSFVAIVGENGSGKTTLIKHINGLLLPTQGNVIIDGKNTKDIVNRNLLRSTVGMLFQNPADQIVASNVEEDIAFGLENLNVPTEEIRIRVSKQLMTMNLAEFAKKPPHLLSGGEMQKLALAGILVRKPKIILFDEPTSMLDPLARASLLEQVFQLHQQGMTILYITHHMEEAIHADQILILQNGRIIANDSPRTLFQNEQLLINAGLETPEIFSIVKDFRALGWNIPKDLIKIEELLPILPHFYKESFQNNSIHAEEPQQTIIEAKNIQHTYLRNTPFEKQALHGVSVSIANNQIHGLAGGNGSGKSTFLQHINGILQPDRGELIVNGIELHHPNTKLIDVIKEVGLVFQNPESQFFEVFVGDEIAYGPKQFKFKDLRSKVRDAMALVGLDFAAYKDRRLETLSGGEKRKVALASTLVLNQDILLFDEPSAGMDPQSRKGLITLFQSLQKQGKTLVISTHRLEELMQISNAVSIMKNGEIIQTGRAGFVFARPDIINQAGLIAPPVVRIANELMLRGWPVIPSEIGTCHELLLTIRRALN
jgi:energy-coupling factor transport system ATP-binding protein